MSPRKQLCLVLSSLVLSSGVAFAAVPKAKVQAAPYKEYTLLNIQTVVSNSERCQAIEHSLKEFAKNPIHLQFANKATPGHLAMKDQSKVTDKHRYIIVEQNVKTGVVDRTGIGRFDINNQAISYVIKIGADTHQANFNYLYPMILAGDNAHCFYTALLKPSAETVEAFKKNIHNGLAAQGADLPAK